MPKVLVISWVIFVAGKNINGQPVCAWFLKWTSSFFIIATYHLTIIINKLFNQEQGVEGLFLQMEKLILWTSQALCPALAVHHTVINSMATKQALI